KFGLDLKSGQLEAAMAMIAAHPRLKWLGLQAHIGSQIFDAQAYEQTATVMVGLLAEIRDRHGLVASELDLGGGLGIAYARSDDPPAIAEAVGAAARAVLAACAERGLTPPRLVLEP